MTTPGQVAGTSAIAVGFGVSMWLLVRFVIIPLGGARMASFRLGRFGRVYTNFFAWVVPGLLVVGGVVGLVVAAVGALTGMTWKTG
jgi:hypothetical protein